MLTPPIVIGGTTRQAKHLLPASSCCFKLLFKATQKLAKAPNKIVSILYSLDFQSSIHECNICRGTINVNLSLLLVKLMTLPMEPSAKPQLRDFDDSFLESTSNIPINHRQAPIKFLGLLDKFIGTNLSLHKTLMHILATSCACSILIAGANHLPMRMSLLRTSIEFQS
jgi:hypothetical protein